MNFRLLLIAAGALTAVLLSVPAWADAILRPAAVVTGDNIRLGDLFDGVGDKANTFVARAPAPGHKAIVDADWLHRVATLNGIDWSTDDPFLEIVIDRPGMTIGHERIQQEIAAALAEKGVSADEQIDIANHDLSLVIPADAPATVAVRDLIYDETTKHFSAIIEAPADSQTPSRVSVAGIVRVMIDVPTIAHPIGRDDVIATRDLTFARMRKDAVRRDAVLDVDQIIGMSPRGTLRTGQTITLADLQKPVSVARGALITIELKSGGMLLTVQGRANEAGAIGDVIKVTNTRSNLIVPARVEGPNLVSVGVGVTPVPATNGGLAMAN
ncbi:MAG TPA: flagellar basal body P-ring formation chaperone FlgA [Magnetospirillaceae bacterium]|jgi:flagella basal body P-ring formation protein FlgA